MNLASTIELYGGGPGSGCNPEVGKCGRPAGAGEDVTAKGPSKEAQDFVASFQPVFQSAAQKFKLAVGDFGLVEGRLKTAASLEEKSIRQNRPITAMEDTAGLRLTVDSMQALTEAVNRVKESFPVTFEDNKINNPTGGVYRAYHMTVEEQGRPVEVQIRTTNQSKLAIWMHDTLYKGALKNSQPAIAYAKNLSNYMNNLDMGGRIGAMPSCPPGIPCFNENMPFVQHLI